MKKLLAIILTLIMAASCMVSAAAALPSSDDIGTQSLNFTLPVVTGITAVWNGEIQLTSWLSPRINPDNVAITVTFEDGTTELLEHWNDGSNRWWWQINRWFDEETGVMTFRYDDSDRRQAFYDANAGLCCCDLNWAPYYAALPQASFAFPANYVEQYVNSFAPLTALELDKVVTTAGQRHVYQFTPTRNGTHTILFESPNHPEYRLNILNANFERLTSGWVYTSFTRNLLAGQTYYFLIETWDEREFKLVVTEGTPQGGGQWCECEWCDFCDWCGNCVLLCRCVPSNPPPPPPPPRLNLWERFIAWGWDVNYYLRRTSFGRMTILLATPFVMPILVVDYFYRWIVYG